MTAILCIAAFLLIGLCGYGIMVLADRFLDQLEYGEEEEDEQEDGGQK